MSTKKPAPKASKAKVQEKVTIVMIAQQAGRSPKVLRAIARNEAYRLSQGLPARLPTPVEGVKHTYLAKDVPAFLDAIKKA